MFKSSSSIFTAETWLPRGRAEVFAFFSDARNLQELTPPWLNFEILTPMPVELRPGALIDYRLRWRGFPMRWRTEIAAWEPPVRFVDRQLRGPYRVWVHEHRFEDRDGGTLMTDEVRYAVPGGWLIDRLWVRRDVERIFAFRRQRMLSLFPHAAR